MNRKGKKPEKLLVTEPSADTEPSRTDLLETGSLTRFDTREPKKNIFKTFTQEEKQEDIMIKKQIGSFHSSFWSWHLHHATAMLFLLILLQ
jgi:hypothetical protein